MITDDDRKVVAELVRLKIWSSQVQMRLFEVVPTDETRPLYEEMLKRQEVDDLRHAPCCPANHYHKRRLVFKGCTCGAAIYAKRDERAERQFQEAQERAMSREKNLEDWTTGILLSFEKK